MTALPHRPYKSGVRAVCVGFAVLLAALAAYLPASRARAETPILGTLKVNTQDGYARLAFKFVQPVPAKIELNWPVLMIRFAHPIDIAAVDQLAAAAPEFIGAARRDPDGGAIRIALARQVKINTTPAAERLYVDLLPDNWTGVMPELPKDVIERLAQRAREADRLQRRQSAEDRLHHPPQIRVKVASEPTFTRFVFDLPNVTIVQPKRGKGTFRLEFDHPIKWDLTDALAAMPSTLQTVKAGVKPDASTVDFMLKGAPDIRTFREDDHFVVDIGHEGIAGRQRAHLGGAKNALLAIQPPATEPVRKEAEADQSGADNELPPMVDVPAPKQRAAAPAPAAKLAAADKPAPPVVKPPPVQQAATTKPAPPVVKPPPVRQAVTEPAPIQHVATKAAPVQPSVAPKPAPVASQAAPQAAPHPVEASMPLLLPKAPKTKSVPTPASAAAPVTPGPDSTVPPPNPNAAVVVGLHQGSDTLRLEFPFAGPTPAAAFTRADTLWLVFDTKANLNINALDKHTGTVIRSATLKRGMDGEMILRIRLKRPQLVSLDTDGPAWTAAIGDIALTPPRPLGTARSGVGRDRANIIIPFDRPASVHAIVDPTVGDRLLVVTALGPTRGFLRQHDYVELHLLASAQGVVVAPIADDVAAALASDKITLGRPGGLSLSSSEVNVADVAENSRGAPFDPQMWGYDRKANFEQRQTELIRAAAAAPPERRMQARLKLARFYLATGMAAEAKGVLNVALGDQRGVPDVTGSVLGAVADVMLHRPEQALKQLNQPQIGNQLEAPVWRAIAYARAGKWSEAHAGFRHIEVAIATLPIELQRMAMMAALKTAIEVRDYDTASRLVDEFDSIGVPKSLAPPFAVLVGRLDQGLGRTTDALTNYRTAAASRNGPAAAEARLREIELRFSLGEMPRNQTIAALETLTTVWRGDATESEGMKMLAHLYTEAGRYRDAFHVMRTALLAHPDSDLTRQIQEEASATFDNLFLSHKGDSLPPLEALALFYDYRELTPIGPRGDEMIRRLADRLVAVDLLDQAAELLQHQVDNRLQGAARAQVATRLATIYLMNQKPERALAVLHATRAAGLAGELHDKRLLLEARALSDVGRHDLALEIIGGVKGPAAMRLRADILWAAHRWRQAAEQIEALYGDRWKKFQPLSHSESIDILRAAVGYALADETMSLARFRERYMPKMAKGPDQRAFEVVSAPIGTGNASFQSVAQQVTSVNTLDAFLNDIRTRYPDVPLAAAKAKAAEPPPKPEKPASVPAQAKETVGKGESAATRPPKVPNKPAAPGKPDTVPTGSIP